MRNFISLKKIEKQEERNILRKLWKLYINSLSEYKEFKESAEQIAEEESKEHEWRADHLIMLDDTPVGFICTGVWPNSFTRHDLYIQEFFVKEEYRRHGIGIAAVKKRLAHSSKDISLFILQKNIPALQFWPKVLAELGYIDRLSDIQATCYTNDGLYFKYFLNIRSD